MIISATILAAGGSSRMGDENKLLLPFNGDLVINRICHTVLNSGLKPVIVVTGFQHKAVEKALPELIDQIAYNPNWEQGMAGSIYTGMSLLPDTVDGNMIVLGDMPLLTTHTLKQLIEQFCVHEGKQIIYPVYSGQQANPVIFPRKYFSEILSSTGDRGCKKVLKQYPDDATGISIDSEEVILDCDTKDDYFRIISQN
ncbi:MAG: nucleotidyltransferase family protein [Candidatus Marinimicrobia bacterium]|nr:nucleotidyltransferase family protein [Candidatus Neomarinimicrobiota bacterium]|tara:strand:- start:2359 stop:2952 length:594 start_codon:yes stop_codon:yes gene_type:complete